MPAQPAAPENPALAPLEIALLRPLEPELPAMLAVAPVPPMAAGVRPALPLGGAGDPVGDVAPLPALPTTLPPLLAAVVAATPPVGGDAS
jgi:hypothetical protein